MANDAYASARLTLAGGRYLLPAWRTAMAPLTWTTVSGVSLASLDPALDPTENPAYPGSAPWRSNTGQSSVVMAWSGGVWDEARGGFWLYGGGHQDYGGNELYFWSATAGWQRVTSPSGGLKTKVSNALVVLDDGLENTDQYADGQPRSLHTYNNVFLSLDGSLCICGGSQYHSGGNAQWYWRFDHAAKRWNKVGSTGSGVYYAFGSSACDPITGDVISVGMADRQMRRFSATTQTWGDYGPYMNTAAWGYNRTLFDPLFGGAIYLRDTAVQYWKPTGVSDLVTTGTPPPTIAGTAGLAFDAPRRRYLYWAGGAIYALAAPVVGSNPQTSAWTWSALASADGSASSAQEPNGTYGRFWCSAALGACGVINRTTETMNVFSLE